MSSDYHKKRYGALALANMALSPTTEIVQVVFLLTAPSLIPSQVFTSKGLLDRIIKMAVRQEIETQREVTALIRFFHSSSCSLIPLKKFILSCPPQTHPPGEVGSGCHQSC